jgi:hypothetical protein
MAIATGLLIYNATQINYNTPFEGDSTVAIICVLAAACAILLMRILQTSLKIKKKSKKR